jgi:ribonucleoside-diphosphate reductase beta chain
MHAGFWTSDKFNFNSDVQDFRVNLTPQERDIVVKTLSAISHVEVRVKRFWQDLGTNLRHPYINDLGVVMANTEVIHNDAYEKLLDVLGLTDTFQSHLETPALKGRVEYLSKHTHRYHKDSKRQYLYALILFTLFVENVSLFSQFYVILWFGRYRNVLKDTNQQVMYTKNEELIHALVGVKLINTIREEYPELFDEELAATVEREASKAFDSESKLIDWMVGDYKGQRFNAQVLKEYVKYKINDSLSQIKFRAPYQIDESLRRDFEWMDEEVLGKNATDFFFKHPVNYQKESESFNEDDLFQ